MIEPAVTPLEDVAVTPLPPERFGEALSADALTRFRHPIERARAARRPHALERELDRGGGGVAEMLRSLIGYVRGAGIDARWIVVPATTTSSG
jgi:trehalose synthase